ncbi:hypothetical protein K438DRAFT_1802330 [Mycena galopus ATCC 62051]|nr:hypothetical protein K438DRAFT_1802330 [Mycena galopus ATCC 62051]
MSLAVTPTSASFFGTVIGSFLYGVFFVLTVLSNGLHIRRTSRDYQHASRRAVMRGALRKPMIMASFMMFLVVTMYWALDMVDTAYGLLESDDPQLYFLAPIRPRAVLGFGFFIASLVICDTMLVYRLWIIWNKSTMAVIFPFITLLGLLACGIGLTYRIAIIPLGESVFSNQVHRWEATETVFNLLMNVYSTTLIAYRIHIVHSDPDVARLHGRHDLKSIIAILVESFALLSGWIVFGAILYATKSPVDAFFRATMGTVSGISFMLINVRVALGWGQTHRFAPGSSIDLNCPPTSTVSSPPPKSVQMDLVDGSLGRSDTDNLNQSELKDLSHPRSTHFNSIVS